MYTLIVFLSMNMLVTSALNSGYESAGIDYILSAENYDINSYVKNLMNSENYSGKLNSQGLLFYQTDSFKKKWLNPSSVNQPALKEVSKFLDWLSYCSDNSDDENWMLYKTIGAINTQQNIYLYGSYKTKYDTNYDRCQRLDESFRQGVDSQATTPGPELGFNSDNHNRSNPCIQTYDRSSVAKGKTVNFGSGCLTTTGEDLATLRITPGPGFIANVNVTYEGIHPANVYERYNRSCEDAWVIDDKSGKKLCPTVAGNGYHSSSHLESYCGEPFTSKYTNNENYISSATPTLSYEIEFVACSSTSALDDDVTEFSNSTISNLTLSLFLL